MKAMGVSQPYSSGCVVDIAAQPDQICISVLNRSPLVYHGSFRVSSTTALWTSSLAPVAALMRTFAPSLGSLKPWLLLSCATSSVHATNRKRCGSYVGGTVARVSTADDEAFALQSLGEVDHDRVQSGLGRAVDWVLWSIVRTLTCFMVEGTEQHTIAP